MDQEDLGRSLIDFDPSNPNARFFATATEMAAALVEGTQAEPVPWPPGMAPVLATPASPPDPAHSLPKTDVVIVTWTSAEAQTLAALLTPGAPLDQWFEYKSNVDTFIPKVTGGTAPFNSIDKKAKDPYRYYHSLGLYYPITLVGKKVLCFKSGLHMDYDGPQFPIPDLWKQIIAETGAELIITTGTGGGVGANVLLGDVIIAAETVFDCVKQFAAEPFHSVSYPTSPLPSDLTSLLTPALLKPNADKVARSQQPSHPDGLPMLFYPGSAVANPRIVTTDFFAFDNTTDTHHLQELGNVCDMGDASLGLAISRLADPPRWAAIRNASDPQIDGSLSPKEQDATAGKIYRAFGVYTTAASVLAAWSLICRSYPLAHPVAEMAAAVPAVSRSLAKSKQRDAQTDASHVLLQIAASSGFSAADVPAPEVSAATVEAVTAYLLSINVVAGEGEIAYRLVRYVDEAGRREELFLVHVTSDGVEAFRGTYLYALGDLIAKTEFVSG